jgi:hypothetical protein
MKETDPVDMRAPAVPPQSSVRQEPEFSSSVNIGPGIACGILAIICALVGIVLTLSAVWPVGIPLMLTSVVLWIAAGRLIKKNDEEPVRH